MEPTVLAASAAATPEGAEDELMDHVYLHFVANATASINNILIQNINQNVGMSNNSLL